MRSSFTILMRSVVRPYYRQNAGFFVLIYLLFFGVVAPSMQLTYHYALIRGLLQSPLFLGMVLLAWLLYALKCRQWLMVTLVSPEFSFLNILTKLNKKSICRLLLPIQALLLLPISSYALAIIGVALYRGYYGAATLVVVYMALLHLAGIWTYQRRLFNPEGSSGFFFSRLPAGRKKASPPYWFFFIRYIIQHNKVILVGIKLSGCVILYSMLGNQEPDRYDIRMPFLCYSLALFGHGVLIYRNRELEERALLFYRGLPLSLLRRGWQYMWLYFLILLPEMLTIGWLTPASLRWKDAIGFMLSGYSLLLLLSSLLFVTRLKMGDFLKLSLGLFGILYLSVLGDVLIFWSAGCLLLAVSLFAWGYWRYES